MPTRHHGSAQERLALDAYVKLMRAGDSLGERLAPTFSAAGLTAGQFGVLEALYHLGPMRLCDVAAKVLRSGGNITLIARNLERHGWVRRRRETADRRAFRLELTPAGRTLIRQTFARHAARLAAEMAVLSPAEQADLGRLCRKLGLAGRAA